MRGIPTVLVLAGLAHASAADGQWTSSRVHFSFSNIVFDLSLETWAIGAQVERLVDCSDAQFLCFSSPTFSLALPRRCTDLATGSWAVGGVRTRVVFRHVGPMPIHGARSGTTYYLGSSERPHQLFAYDPNVGLTGLYWDNRGEIDFAAMAGDNRLAQWLTSRENDEARRRVYFRRTTLDRVGECRR